jgi:cob(I)alamin adenosyltransferase
MGRLRKGYVQLYTGTGKGKTTAAVGLALRAAGAGLRVYFAQFAKGSASGELAMLKKASCTITIQQFGARSFIKKSPSKIDRTLAANGFAKVTAMVASGRYDVVVLDEIAVACHFNLIPAAAVRELITVRPAHVEIILTGRCAPRELVDAADLVTEMKEIRHYFRNGVLARQGIEY